MWQDSPGEKRFTPWIHKSCDEVFHALLRVRFYPLDDLGWRSDDRAPPPQTIGDLLQRRRRRPLITHSLELPVAVRVPAANFQKLRFHPRNPVPLGLGLSLSHRHAAAAGRDPSTVVCVF